MADSQTAPEVKLPRRNLAGKSRAKRPGSDTQRGQAITNTLTRYVENAIASIRNRQDINEVIRTLSREDGLFSSSVNSMVALSSQTGFRIAGRDASGAMSLEVMSAAYSLMDRFNMLHDYSQGYNDRAGTRGLLATLLTDVVCTGGCGVEVVLDKSFVPDQIATIGYSTVEWNSDGTGNRYPTQDGGDIDLNIPTVFIGEYNRNSDEAYSVSPLRPGIGNTIRFNEFLEDMHRALNRVGHSRLVASLISEKIAAAMPDDVRGDPVKEQSFYDTIRGAVEDQLSGLEPEDAIVSYDSVDYDIKDMGGEKADYSTLLATLSNLTGASLKTPASVSGIRASGGQGLSNAETMVYLKVVEGTRAPVEEILSRALTLSVRLLGIEGHCQFEFMPINLRPEEELEAYKGTKQNRILTLLSYGLINDAEACYSLGLRPQSLVNVLAGSGFYTSSNTSAASDDDAERVSSSGRSLNPGTPSKSGGADQ